MNLTLTIAPFGAKPPVTKPNPKFLAEVGEEGIREIVFVHYELIKESNIRHLFPKDEAEFEMAKKHASDFFIQICGGTKHFEQNRGTPRMIARHAPFRITEDARNTWLELYIPILEDLKAEGISEESLESFWNYLDIFSLWMINTK